MNRAIELRLKEKLDKRVALKARQLRNGAVENCPVDTGRLRQSITVKKLEPAVYSVGTNVEYAPYVEYGTRHQAPQPYFRPAIERVKAES